MKRVVFGAACFAMGVAALAVAQTTLDMEKEAATALEKSDAELNKVYKELRETLRGGRNDILPTECRGISWRAPGRKPESADGFTGTSGTTGTSATPCGPWPQPKIGNRKLTRMDANLNKLCC